MDIKDKAQSEMLIAEKSAVTILVEKHNILAKQVTIRALRPTDLKTFTAGTSGTSKTMGENDLTVATGTTENTLSTEVSTSECIVIEGLYLPAFTGGTTNYIAIYIGDAKQRWYRGARINAEPNSTLYFDDPVVIRPGDEVKVRFLTSAAVTLNIEVLGKLLKAQA